MRRFCLSLAGILIAAGSALFSFSLAEEIQFRIPAYHDTPVNLYADQSAQRISLNFTNIRVRELLQIIAQFTKLNFIINDKVGGEMSVHLNQIPWTQALDVILKSQDLGQRRVGEIVYIAPVSTLVNQQVSELEAKQKMRDLVGLEDRIVHLKYAKADEIQKILVTNNFTLLSSRGATNVDARTNSIWISDTPEHLKTVIRMIDQLDKPVKQIMIEARIVTVRRQFEQQLGSRFGLTSASKLSGSLTGANELAIAGGHPLSVPVADRLNFDAPASGDIFGSTGSPGRIGLAIARLGSNFIDLELSALEQQNDLNIISSPRLITSSQQTAYIKAGQELPFANATSSGATSTSFQEAALKLDVTPQITPDNRVILKLKISNNRPGTKITSAQGESFTIDTEEEESTVLLNDHQTVVLGGVYQRTSSNIIRRIPFLWKIPVIGNLFKHKTDTTDNNELLIFLTPHIIQKPEDISTT